MRSARVDKAAALARGRATKRRIALTACLCGLVPAVVLGVLFPGQPAAWAGGFLVGLLWANGFEYVYHRYLLHWPGTYFAQPHLLHHSTVGTAGEAEHINLAGSPSRIVLLFVVNGAPVVALDRLWGLGAAPAVLLGFMAYLLAAEEIHWRIHMGGWLPPGLGWARPYHFGHHDYPDSRYNIFLPLFDWLVRGARAR